MAQGALFGMGAQAPSLAESMPLVDMQNASGVEAGKQLGQGLGSLGKYIEKKEIDKEKVDKVIEMLQELERRQKMQAEADKRGISVGQLMDENKAKPNMVQSSAPAPESNISNVSGQWGSY